MYPLIFLYLTCAAETIDQRVRAEKRKVVEPCRSLLLGTPVVPFYPFHFGVSLCKQNSRKKGTVIFKGLLGNLVLLRFPVCVSGGLGFKVWAFVHFLTRLRLRASRRLRTSGGSTPICVAS